MLEFVLSMGFFSEIKRVAENAKGVFVLVDEMKAKDKNYLSKNMTARNQNMSDNIENAFNTKKCEKGILIVGKAHNETSETSMKAVFDYKTHKTD